MRRPGASLLKQSGEKLLGSEARFPLEQRIFHIVMLSGVLLTAFGTVMDAKYGIDIRLDLAFFGCWVLLYGFSRFRRGFRAVSIIAAVVLVFAFIPYQWTISGGITGAIPVYTVLFIALLPMMLHGPERILAVCSTIAVVVLLTGYDASRTGVPWQNVFWNSTVHFAVILAATALVVILYSNTYIQEKRRSESYAPGHRSPCPAAGLLCGESGTAHRQAPFGAA
jgi:hypothetical protein